MYEIETKDFFEDIKSEVESKFDTGDSPEDHPSGIGMTKDEAAGRIIEEFVGLRAKL